MPVEFIKMGTGTGVYKMLQRLPGEPVNTIYERWNQFNRFTADEIAKEIPAAMAATYLTPTEYALIGELLARGGAVQSSHWTIGGGKTKTRASLPPFAELFERNELKIPPLAQSIFASNRRIKRVVSFYDYDWVLECFHEATKIVSERIDEYLRARP